MLILTMVTWSAISPAISSRTGETLRQGPHHSAQKSTRTGLSGCSTSPRKVLSVTTLAAPLEKSYEGSWSVGQEPLRVEGSGTAAARRGDRLAVAVVDEVSAREAAGNVGQGRAPLHQDVAL